MRLKTNVGALNLILNIKHALTSCTKQSFSNYKYNLCMHATQEQQKNHTMLKRLSFHKT